MEACKEIENDYDYKLDTEDLRSRITNPYLVDKIKKLNEKVNEENRRYSAMGLCKRYLKSSMKDTDSFKVLNSNSSNLILELLDTLQPIALVQEFKKFFKCFDP